jgi:pyridinium-3,5-bisthiocarboxylic acid mononucleotide nickel chelatase
MKVQRLGKHVISATPEYEECQRIALEKRLSLEDVYEITRRVIETRLLAHKTEIR